jgi:threonine/homoserine/homoserine lactone efflux protein
LITHSGFSLLRHAMYFRYGSGLAWWESHRLQYNAGLIASGVLAFVFYAVICFAFLPQFSANGDVEITPFTMLFQGIGYALMMVLANLCYFLGPILEGFVEPRNIPRYRRIAFRLGFWFSVLLPFAILLWLTILVVFFPEHR